MQVHADEKRTAFFRCNMQKSIGNPARVLRRASIDAFSAAEHTEALPTFLLLPRYLFTRFYILFLRIQPLEYRFQ